MIYRFSILDSTNTLALQWIRSGQLAPGDVVVAEEQLAGRGRQGRRWASSQGALLMTMVLPLPAQQPGWASLAAGVAVAEAVQSLGVPARLKWPNDVLLRGGKLGGILVEAAPGFPAAVGIGLNVRNPPPPATEAPEFRRLADDLPQVEVEQVLTAVCTVLQEVWPLLDAWDLSPLRRRWDALDATLGREVFWPDGNLHGIAEGIDAEGRLRIATAQGIHFAAAGEVRFRRAED